MDEVEMDSCNKIISQRNSFQVYLAIHKGPKIVPTVFLNHPERQSFVRDREKRLGRKPRYPPFYPVFIFTSIRDIYFSIKTNFKNKMFLPHDDLATLVCLKESACGELAMQEMLIQPSPMYSQDPEILKTSKFVETNTENKESEQFSPCECKIIVDFSIILPEGKISTVNVICPDCRAYVETVLMVGVLEKLKKEITQIISQLNFDVSENQNRSIARLPLRPVRAADCPLADGLLGVVPLAGIPTKPSIFVRARLSFYCNNLSLFGNVVHKKGS